MSVTIYDVAQHAGVSLSTVSRVLNNSGYVKQETRDKIYAAIEDLNYIPSTVARSLSKNENHNIAVVTLFSVKLSKESQNIWTRPTST